MATRRPTTVKFSSDADCDSCVIRLEMGNKHAEFSEEGDSVELDDLLNLIEAQSKESSEKAYGEEVVLSICAPTLPNINFTDLPAKYLEPLTTIVTFDIIIYGIACILQLGLHIVDQALSDADADDCFHHQRIGERLYETA